LKAVPKVNTDGLYIEDELVDDAFTGVVPFYTTPEGATDAEESLEPILAGYVIGFPVTPGLFRPRFDLEAWSAYRDAVTAAEEAYRSAYDEWTSLPEDERGEPPIYTAPDQPELWGEGLSQGEIEEITRPKPQKPDELERLRAENTELKLALTELAEAQELDKTEMQLALTELAELVAGTGGEGVG